MPRRGTSSNKNLRRSWWKYEVHVFSWNMDVQTSWQLPSPWAAFCSTGNWKCVSEYLWESPFRRCQKVILGRTRGYWYPSTSSLRQLPCHFSCELRGSRAILFFESLRGWQWSNFDCEYFNVCITCQEVERGFRTYTKKLYLWTLSFWKVPSSERICLLRSRISQFDSEAL